MNNPDNKNEYTRSPEVDDDKFNRHIELIDGKQSFVSIVKINNNPNIHIETDEIFSNTGIITEPDSLLIDQKATKDLIGHPVGKKPEDYIANTDNVLAIAGNHFGWQKSSFIIQNERLKLLANDKNLLTGSFATLCMDNAGIWSLRQVKITNGESEDLNSIKLGINGAPIVKDGVATDLSDLLDDPRIKADLRNIFDFSYGNKVPSDFFQDIRKFSPEEKSGKNNPRAFSRMILGKKAVLSMPTTENQETQSTYNRLAQIINNNDNQNTLGGMKIDNKHNRNRLGIFNQLPEQHMPLIGFGTNDSGDLIVVAVDGRQKDSAGVSIPQLAELMVKNGVKNGILGCGGGDVCIVKKENKKTTILNSPANIDSYGNRVTRLVPNLVIIPLGD